MLEVKKVMQTSGCDVGKGTTEARAVRGLDRSWTGELGRVAPLPTHLCRDLVVITTHPYEAMSAAGGVISCLAAKGTDVEVLAVSDGECAVSRAVSPGRQPSRRQRNILAAYRRLGVPEVRRHR